MECQLLQLNRMALPLWAADLAVDSAEAPAVVDSVVDTAQAVAAADLAVDTVPAVAVDSAVDTAPVVVEAADTQRPFQLPFNRATTPTVATSIRGVLS